MRAGVDDRAAADRARENSDSRAPLPCCASTPSARPPSPTAASPARRVRRRRASSICRSISYSSAFCRKRNEFRFLTSAFVPSAVVAGRTHRHVGVAAQAALLHVAVVDAEPHEDRAQAAEELRGVGRRPQVGLGDDLDERHAAAVEVDVGLAIGVGKPLVQRLAGVLFHVDARDADARRRRAARSRPRRRRQRLLVLRDLIALRQVRIEVVLAREDRGLVDPCSRARAPRGSRVDRRAVQHRQRARQARDRPGRRACSAARRTPCCSRRRSSWRSAAARGSRGR